jgi:hypothetical protein
MVVVSSKKYSLAFLFVFEKCKKQGQACPKIGKKIFLTNFNFAQLKM